MGVYTDYPEIPEERGDDIHGLEMAGRADLTLFMAGNQFMVMPELIDAFRKENPAAETVVYQTLPPGLELRQILAGGARFRGKTYKFHPDVYSSVSEKAMKTLAERDIIASEDYFVYLHNRLALMVRKGNPRAIASVLDLGREDIVVSQPNPEYEHIAEHVAAMYEQAGGQELVETILEKKLADGTALLTTVHHRETPTRLLRGEADVGPVWYTEIEAAKRAGLEIEGVELDPSVDQREAINYYIAPLRIGRNPENTRSFLRFVTAEPARRIFQKYGFITEIFSSGD
ncbi:MAG: substrate-binding domain-containing protein [Desulfobacterales bacterium]|nr:substrate-binding domain-containing protein [Desulfobacterales bacterium]